MSKKLNFKLKLFPFQIQKGEGMQSVLISYKVRNYVPNTFVYKSFRLPIDVENVFAYIQIEPENGMS